MGEDKSWNSENFAEDFRKLSEVPDEGIEMVYTRMTYNHGENNYHAVHGVENGVDVAYLFSSNGLERLLKKVHTEIVGKKILIEPSGTDKERKYKVSQA